MASSIITIAQPPLVPGGPNSSTVSEMHVASSPCDESEHSDFTLFTMSEEEDAKDNDEGSPEKTRKDRETSFEKLEGTRIPSTSAKESRHKASEMKRKHKRQSRAPEAHIQLKEEKVQQIPTVYCPYTDSGQTRPSLNQVSVPTQLYEPGVNCPI